MNPTITTMSLPNLRAATQSNDRQSVDDHNHTHNNKDHNKPEKVSTNIHVLVSAIRRLHIILFNSQTGCVIWALMFCAFLLFAIFLFFGIGPRLYYKRAFVVAYNCTIIDFELQTWQNITRTKWDPSKDSGIRFRGVWHVFIEDERFNRSVNCYYNPWPRTWDTPRSRYLFLVENRWSLNTTKPSCLMHKKRNSCFIDSNVVQEYSIGAKTVGYGSLTCLCLSIVIFVAMVGYRIKKATNHKLTKKQELDEEMRQEEELKRLFGSEYSSDEEDEEVVTMDVTSSPRRIHPA